MELFLTIHRNNEKSSPENGFSEKFHIQSRRSSSSIVWNGAIILIKWILIEWSDDKCISFTTNLNTKPSRGFLKAIFMYRHIYFLLTTHMKSDHDRSLPTPRVIFTHKKSRHAFQWMNEYEMWYDMSLIRVFVIHHSKLIMWYFWRGHDTEITSGM